jgi:A118 family predicted phage portal protein
MGIIATIKGWWNRMFFKADAKRVFDTDILLSDRMNAAVTCWNQIYTGHPPWVDDDSHIKTINFAKSVSSETARLTCLDLSIKISGSARASYLQKTIDNMFDNIREYVEKGCVNGTVILKPNGKGVDCFSPQRFLPTETDGNRNIRAAIFFDFYTKSDDHYTRMEYHRFVDGVYMVSNRCYLSKSSQSLGHPIDITKTPWKDLMQDVAIENLEKPLFAVFKIPMANNIDADSPLGISVFAEALEELRDLDIAYSRNAGEIFDSERIVLADDRLMFQGSVKDSDGNVIRRYLKKPRYVKNVMSESSENYYQEINPNLNTDVRVKGINNILSILAYKCGYSNGYFSFDSMTGIQTATGVEASQQRTIQFIKDVRDKLQMAMDDLIYAIDKYADLYDLCQVGVYDAEYGFGDIAYSYEEDKKTWWGYVQAGRVPAWMYFVKFENMSEEEARAMQAELDEEEARKQSAGLFGEE